MSLSLRNDEHFAMENFMALGMPSSDPWSSEQDAAIAITIVFPAVALLIVGIRVVGRISSRQFGVVIKANFVGIKFEDIPPHDPIPGLIWNYAIEILYNPVLALVKTSILLFLLRLFGQKRGVRQFIIWVNTANILHMIGVFFAIVFQCTPIEKAWNPFIAGTCVDTRVLFTTTSVFSILTDLLVLGLPLKIFIGLKIPRRTKLVLMFIFLLGFIVTITSVVRMVLLIQGFFMLESIVNLDGNIGFVTSAVETNLVLITASAPALRPLLRAWFPRVFGAGRGDDADGATTKRRVLDTSTTTTGITRLKSQAQRQSQSPRASSEEQAMPTFDTAVVRRSDICIQFDPRFGDLDDPENKRMGKWF
ncbi:hypothetical protein F4779DRAFT_613331 [Xylariaceae sp. FL0662B]|nr:hypothetical protein F4779DRAFT_613331 [Xylariaceae sp. FL0662B]